ncbi:MAG: hypothetical protein U5L03_10160 [Burkholderiaceae bacterium]|nr:hypothetical protein [Burkholderiaceae bacterium]
MSTATLTMNSALSHAFSRLVETLFVSHSPARTDATPSVVPHAETGKVHLSLLDRFDRWFDGMTDDRAELERYLSRAQNIADLENRMREVMNTPPPLRF